MAPNARLTGRAAYAAPVPHRSEDAGGETVGMRGESHYLTAPDTTTTDPIPYD